MSSALLLFYAVAENKLPDGLTSFEGAYKRQRLRPTGKLCFKGKGHHHLAFSEYILHHRSVTCGSVLKMNASFVIVISVILNKSPWAGNRIGPFPTPTPPIPHTGIEKWTLKFQPTSGRRLTSMSIEHILGYTGWLWSDVINNRTVFAKAPNEWTQIEHNICGRRCGGDLVFHSGIFSSTLFLIKKMLPNFGYNLPELNRFSKFFHR